MGIAEATELASADLYIITLRDKAYGRHDTWRFNFRRDGDHRGGVRREGSEAVPHPNGVIGNHH